MGKGVTAKEVKELSGGAITAHQKKGKHYKVENYDPKTGRNLGGRRFGTNAEYRLHVETVDNQIEIERWVADNLTAALKFKTGVLAKDSKATPAVKNKVASEVMDFHGKFFSAIGGVAKPSIGPEREQAAIKEEAKTDGPLIMLDFIEEEDE